MNRPYFIECSVPETQYAQGAVIKNNPINLALCLSFSKDKANTSNILFLVFKMIDGTTMEWLYNWGSTGPDKLYDRIDHKPYRDKDYDRIIKLFGRLSNE